MCPVGCKDQLIDLKMFFAVCVISVAVLVGCCLTMHIS